MHYNLFKNAIVFTAVSKSTRAYIKRDMYVRVRERLRERWRKRQWGRECKEGKKTYTLRKLDKELYLNLSQSQ